MVWLLVNNVIRSALTHLKAWVFLVDDIEAAFATNNLAFSAALLE